MHQTNKNYNVVFCCSLFLLVIYMCLWKKLY